MLPLRDRLVPRRVPVVNYLLIAVNVLVFAWEEAAVLSGNGRDLWGAELVPARFMAQPLEDLPTVLTSMFMHGGWKHIAGNMLFLWIFGDNVEDALGRLPYLAFYLLSGVAAAAAQILIDPGSPVAMVGASGAIAGVLAAYVTLYPTSPITVLNPVPLLWLFMGLLIELPAWVVIGLFFVMNLFDGFASLGGQQAGGVAFFAHIGGFVAGLFLVRIFLDDRRGRKHDRWEGFRPPPPRLRPTDHEGSPRAYDLPPPQRRPWDA
jgi:membrane associated rhomboid family serine protease